MRKACVQEVDGVEVEHPMSAMLGRRRRQLKHCKMKELLLCVMSHRFSMDG